MPDFANPPPIVQAVSYRVREQEPFFEAYGLSVHSPGDVVQAVLIAHTHAGRVNQGPIYPHSWLQSRALLCDPFHSSSKIFFNG